MIGSVLTRMILPKSIRGISLTDAAIAAALLIAVLFAPAVDAGSTPAPEQFQIGKQAFEAGNYLAALESFEAAVAAGMSGPAVHFNIGVSAYRLGRLSRAETAFLEVARTPQMVALAHYNLGLVALRAGKAADARHWFAMSEQESGDQRLRALASAQLSDRSRQPQRTWSGYAAFAVGYDDNVALISEADVLDVSNTGDSFAELQLSANTWIAQQWRLDANLGVLDYQDLNDFDQISASAAARYRRRVIGWNGEVILQGAYSTLGGDAFQAKRMLALQASKSLPGDWRVRTRYRFSLIDGLGSFDDLDGQRHEIDARAAWGRGAWDFDIEYSFDSSDYSNKALSLSRHAIAINVQRAFKDIWILQAQLARDLTRYDAGSSDEDRNEWELAVSRVLSRRWRVVVRYGYANNAAQRPEFDYRRNRISAGVEATL